ncbi:unnamed protein product (macronuclear) [Paramecium tetraurelia]|uniref:Uncharacterized protein n=1 Tax=Paramecium tetraurelia TaxID=5888 RepID=A0BZ40_PARTE|nr:uncharacterized protein GSPATT00033660001 [Paramecium tetraurelia]CAK63807.1 unnamed protein product [Paramecium tetraurelia]|eukprot:XP_001431205.1 hypothetical protein (macronuclear) [Paramecium tetraurelia strain d4-2]
MIQQITDQEEDNTSIDQQKQTQQSLQSLIQIMAIQNNNEDEHNYASRDRNCSISYCQFAMFAHKSDLIKRVVQPLQIDGFNEIEKSKTHLRRKTQRGVEYIIEDTEQ